MSDFSCVHVCTCQNWLHCMSALVYIPACVAKCMVATLSKCVTLCVCHVYMPACVQVRDWTSVFLVGSPLTFWDRSSMYPRWIDGSAWPAWVARALQEPTCLFPHPVVGWQKCSTAHNFLCGCWQSKLKPCLYSRNVPNWTIISTAPNNWIVFGILKLPLGKATKKNTLSFRIREKQYKNKGKISLT